MMKKPENAGKNRQKYTEFFGEDNGQVQNDLLKLQNENIIQRIWEQDHTVWEGDRGEITSRLGWLHSPETMSGVIRRITGFTRLVRADGFNSAVLLGMGGSSLAPDLFSKVFPVEDGYLKLQVLDSTDPGAVREMASRIDIRSTLFIVSTKSGTTTETLSFFRYFFNMVIGEAGVDTAGRHFAAITDPGSPLVDISNERSFRDVFLNDPDIGGRYSALSFFGLVPAALMGVDLERLLGRASAMAEKCISADNREESGNPAAQLGAAIGSFALSGRDKLTFITSSGIEAFGAWAEQLIAESTGKDGKGILPVDGETPGKPGNYGGDRLFVHLRLTGDDTHDEFVQSLIGTGHPVIRIDVEDTYDLGGEFFRWEMATAVAGHVMDINPFDQPNVESAKVQARTMLDAYARDGRLPEQKPSVVEGDISVYTSLSADTIKGTLLKFMAQAEPGDYAALQAYLKPSVETWELLQDLRSSIREKFNIATTLGYGPRFLHSTGQLHKGDAGRGLFLQITSTSSEDLPIPDTPTAPGSSTTFGVLKAAQAMGDRQALLDAGRRVIRLELGSELSGGLKLLKEMI